MAEESSKRPRSNLTVTAQPSFTISAIASAVSVAQGNQGTSTITTNISNGFNNSISLSASGMPSGTTVTFNPQTIPAPGIGASLMTIYGRGEHAGGNLSHYVTGSGGGIQQTVTVTLTVTGPVQLHHFGLAGLAQRGARQSGNLDHHHYH